MRNILVLTILSLSVSYVYAQKCSSRKVSELYQALEEIENLKKENKTLKEKLEGKIEDFNYYKNEYKNFQAAYTVCNDALFGVLKDPIQREFFFGKFYQLLNRKNASEENDDDNGNE